MTIRSLSGTFITWQPMRFASSRQDLMQSSLFLISISDIKTEERLHCSKNDFAQLFITPHWRLKSVATYNDAMMYARDSLASAQIALSSWLSLLSPSNNWAALKSAPPRIIASYEATYLLVWPWIKLLFHKQTFSYKRKCSALIKLNAGKYLIAPRGKYFSLSRWMISPEIPDIWTALTLSVSKSKFSKHESCV